MGNALLHKFPVNCVCPGFILAELKKNPIRGKKWRWFYQACRCPIAGPSVLLGGSGEPGTDRIEDDVAGQLQEIRVLVDNDRLIPSLEDVARSVVLTVEFLRIDAVEVSHAPREIPFGCFNQQMVVVVHEALAVILRAKTAL